MSSFTPNQENEDSTFSLSGLPVEIVIEILQNTGVLDVHSVSRVSKRFKNIITANWAVILRPVLTKEMAPVDAFMRVFDVCSPQVAVPLEFAPENEAAESTDEEGEENGDGESNASDDEDGDGNETPDEGDNSSDGIDTILSMSEGDEEEDKPNARKDEKDTLLANWASGLSYRTVMGVCLAIKGWEYEFHRLRFSCPHHQRSLQDHELQRLRHGLYVWWMYAAYFHERETQTKLLGPDNRIVFMRQLSTSHLHEITDMWETVKSAVSREVCPSISDVMARSGGSLSWREAERVGWGEEEENEQILGTIMKLRPEDLLRLLVNRHRFATKASVIQFARLKNPVIEDSVETLSDAVQITILEREWMLVCKYGGRALNRRWYFPPKGYFPRPWGGIVDYKRPETEELRGRYAQDHGEGMGVAFPINANLAERRFVVRQGGPGRLGVSRTWAGW